MFVVLLAFQWFRVTSNIEQSSVYPQHRDQIHLTRAAKRIIQKGTLNPKWFNYPSAPIYLTAAGMSLGFIKQQQVSKSPLKPKDIGSVDVPIIRYPGIVNGARQLFASVAMLGLAMLGWMGRKLYGGHVLWLAPLVLLSTKLFHHLSWSYLNVDILGATGAWAMFALIMFARDSRRIQEVVIFPAMCAGFAIACKYTMVVCLPPLVLSLWLLHRRDRVRRSLLATGVALLTFVVLCPYSVLDLDSFLTDAGWEVWHYRVMGHAGHNAKPGLEQLAWHLGVFVKEFTWLGVTMALLGIVEGVRRDWRGTAPLLLFCVGSLYLYAQQRAHFSRNCLSLLGITAVWLVLGGQWLFQAGRAFLEGRRPFLQMAAERRRALTLAFGAGLVVIFAWGRPSKVLAENLTGPRETRVELQEWLNEHLTGQVVHVPKELWFDTRSVDRNVTVKRFKSKKRNILRVAKRNGQYAVKVDWKGEKRRRREARICGEVVKRFRGKKIAVDFQSRPTLDVVRIAPCPK